MSFLIQDEFGEFVLRDPDLMSEVTGLKCSDESLTRQSEKEDADINTIVKRFGITGSMPESLVPPSFGDFVGVVDFRSAMEAIRDTQESFMELPAEVRSRFANDPQVFMDFCTALKPDGSGLLNLAEMRRMGLAVPETVVLKPEPLEVKVVNAEAPKEE